MSDEKLNLPEGYDSEAEPVDVTERAPRGAGDLVDGFRRMARVNAQIALLDAKRKSLQTELIGQMRTPVLMRHPVTGELVLVAAAQARPIKVDVAELRKALLDYGFDGDEVDTIVSDVLKPPEVDTKEDGLFVQAVERGQIPLEVVAKVAKEKPSSAYIGFNKLNKSRPKTGPE